MIFKNYISSFWEWEKWRQINGIWRNIGEWSNNNVVTDEGINHHLEVELGQGTQIEDWYLVLYENDYDPVVTDTYLSHGYTECEALQETSRPVWQQGGVASKQISNVSNKASFTFSLNKTLYGGAMVGGGSDPSVIGDTAGGGVLRAAARFAGGSQGVIAGDVVKLTVTVAASSG